MRFPLLKRRFSAFTLVELIVVITILAILATVGFLALSGYTQDARDSAIKANVRSVQTAIASESALTGNSPRYYVIHDADYALTGAFAYVDGTGVPLTGGTWNAAGTNYSAGKPDYAKLKLNPEKFKVAESGFRSAAETFASYDPASAMVGAADFFTKGANGQTRSVSFFQTAGISPATKIAAVSGNFPASGNPAGYVSGLLRAEPGSATNLTGALVDGGTGNGSATASCSANYVLISGSCVPNSCLAIKTAYPASADGMYSVDPDGNGGTSAFNAYCDMTTNGGGWTLVFSANDGTRFNVSTDSWSDVNSPSYTLTLAKKAMVSNIANDTLIVYGTDKFAWSGKKLPFTSTAAYEQICGTTSADSKDWATSKCFGWSPVGILYGWVFWVTNSSGFDHHNTTNWNMLNASCGNHYVYEHNYNWGSGYKSGVCNDTTKSTVRLSYFMK